MKPTIKAYGLTLMMALAGCMTSCAEENNAADKKAATGDESKSKTEAVG
jgi:hypothetical protein